MNIGINGFGRIGRLVFRAGMKNPNVNIVGVNDLLDPNHLSYLLKYDSVHGIYEEDIKIEGNKLIVNGKKITGTRLIKNLLKIKSYGWL